MVDVSVLATHDGLCAVDEILDPVFCVDLGRESACHRAAGCSTYWLLDRLPQAIHDLLDSITLAELYEYSHPSLE